MRHGNKSISREANFAEDLAYWEENLRGAPELLELPTDRPRPRAISYRGGKNVSGSTGSWQTLYAIAAGRKRPALFTVFAAVLNTLLYRYPGRKTYWWEFRWLTGIGRNCNR